MPKTNTQILVSEIYAGIGEPASQYGNQGEPFLISTIIEEDASWQLSRLLVLLSSPHMPYVKATL
jgi:hypothetical protein